MRADANSPATARKRRLYSGAPFLGRGRGGGRPARVAGSRRRKPAEHGQLERRQDLPIVFGEQLDVRCVTDVIGADQHARVMHVRGRRQVVRQPEPQSASGQPVFAQVECAPAITRALVQDLYEVKRIAPVGARAESLAVTPAGDVLIVHTPRSAMLRIGPPSPPDEAARRMPREMALATARVPEVYYRDTPRFQGWHRWCRRKRPVSRSQKLQDGIQGLATSVESLWGSWHLSCSGSV